MITPAQDPARIARRRREHERQAVIYGVLVALLAVAGLGALAIYTGAIDAPFARGFTPATREAQVTPPCLPPVEGQPDGALPLPYGQVHLNVFNASGIAGIAAANESVLSARGFVVDTVDNSSIILTSSELRFGEQGIVAAYTIAAQFPRMRLVLDAREDASVDFYVGQNYDRPLEEDEVPIAADAPLSNRDGCAPAAEIDKAPAPTPTEQPEADGEDTPAEG